MTPVARADVGGVLIRGCRGRSQLRQIVAPFKAASPRESGRFAVRGRGLSSRAIRSRMSTTRARESKLREVLRRRAAHNGFELSRPASGAAIILAPLWLQFNRIRRAMGGSASASCYAYLGAANAAPMRIPPSLYGGLHSRKSARRRLPTRAGFDSPVPSLQGRPK
jgi:hypothetical protein